MPLQIEHEGKQLTVYTQEELDKEVAGLKTVNANLKAEKTEEIEKARAAKDALLLAEEAKAKAEGDSEKLKQIAEQRDQESKAKLNEFKATIQAEKVTNMINKVTDTLGATGQHKEDLEVLIKARYEFGYDMDTHAATVRGENVSSVDDVIKVIKESGRYDAYLPGDGSTGGGSQGNNGSGASTKKLSEMTATEEAIFANQYPEKYAQMRGLN